MRISDWSSDVCSSDRPADTQDKPAAAPGKPGWRERLRGSGFSRGLGGLFSRNPKLDDDLPDEIETALITADLGLTATTRLVEHPRKRMKPRELAHARPPLAALRIQLAAPPEPVATPLPHYYSPRQSVTLHVGVHRPGN